MNAIEPIKPQLNYAWLRPLNFIAFFRKAFPFWFRKAIIFATITLLGGYLLIFWVSESLYEPDWSGLADLIARFIFGFTIFVLAVGYFAPMSVWLLNRTFLSKFIRINNLTRLSRRKLDVLPVPEELRKQSESGRLNYCKNEIGFKTPDQLLTIYDSVYSGRSTTIHFTVIRFNQKLSKAHAAKLSEVPHYRLETIDTNLYLSSRGYRFNQYELQATIEEIYLLVNK